MELKSQWNNNFIQPERRQAAEAAMDEYLLEHFGSASSAFNCKVSFNNTHKQPNHPWNIAIVKGIALSTRGLPPSSCTNKGWEVKFFDN